MRVVIVDDSRTSRTWIRHVISTNPQLEVVGEACDAKEARELIKRTNPDVVTLDIEMPGMSGLEFLKRLIRLRPMPVVMLSSFTKRGSAASITALSFGAIDCIEKPKHSLCPDEERALSDRILEAAHCEVRSAKPGGNVPAKSPAAAPQEGNQLVLIGSSTGGVVALETVLGDLDPNGPPVVIVQHMPGPFLVSFAQRLNQLFAQDIGLLEWDVPLQYGQVRLAPGTGQHSVLSPKRRSWAASYVPGNAKDLHCPSVDELFHSAVFRASDVTAALLTGLGRDGAAGLKALRDGGAHTIGQDRHSSVIYGMPGAAYELGAVVEQLPIEQIGQAINRTVTRRQLKSDKAP